MTEYCQGKTFATLSKLSQSETPAPGLSLNQLRKAFISGSFSTEEQKARLDFKKLVARSTQPKTRRVRLMFEWMLDDNATGNRRPRKTKQEAA